MKESIPRGKNNRFMIEPRRRHGEVSCWKKKKIALVADEGHVAAWKEQFHNSKVKRTCCNSLFYDMLHNPRIYRGMDILACDMACSGGPTNG